MAREAYFDNASGGPLEFYFGGERKVFPEGKHLVADVFPELDVDALQGMVLKLRDYEVVKNQFGETTPKGKVSWESRG
jgi:hypothetical protein